MIDRTLVLSALATLAIAVAAPAQTVTSSLRGWGYYAFDTGGRDGQFTKVAAHLYTTAVLRQDGRIFVNGDNWASPACVPELPAGRRYVDMDIRWLGGAAVVDDGSIVVWGAKYNPSFPNYAIPTYPPAPPLPTGIHYERVGVGGSHVLALRSDGLLAAWGDNSLGQCNVPSLLPGQSVAGFRVRGATNFVFLNDGTCLVFGSAAPGSALPQLPGSVHYLDVAWGHDHYLALRSDGEVVAWGNNLYGDCNVPSLPPGTVYTAIAAGWQHSVAARSDGAIVVWGTNSAPPPPVPPGIPCIGLACGDHHAVALLLTGQVLAWGRNGFLQSYVPSRDDVTHGAQQAHFIDQSVGYLYSLAVTSEGRVVGWGSDNEGQSTPPPWLANHVVRRASAGVWHSAAMTQQGEVFAWGNNNNGRASIPPLPPGVTYVDLACALHHTILVRSDGQAVACGPNFSGEGTIPPLPPGVTYVACDAHEYKSMLLRSDGQAVSFGESVGNQHAVPPLPTGLTYTDIGAGWGFGAAIRSDGSALVWGNTNQNGIGNRALPVLPFGVYYVEVDGGYTHFSLRRSDGRVEVCGRVVLTLNAVPALDPGTSYTQISSGYDIAGGRVAAQSTYVGIVPGCAGTRPATRLVPRDTPKIGRTLEVTLFDLPTSTAVMVMGFTQTTPQPLASLGMPGCAAHISIDAAMGLAGTGNQAKWLLPIPDQPLLLGVTFYNQALVLDPQANAFGAVVSDAAEGVVGDR